MNLADERLKELDNPSLATDERALLHCGLAAEFIQEGQYEVACQALGDFWRGVGERPDLDALRENVAAEVLLHVGVVSGWIGACRQIQGAQESAKDLISESATFFETLSLPERAAIARCKLALCYWREGEYDEARVLLTNVLEWLTEAADRAEAIVKLAIVECSAGRYGDALTLLKEHAPIFDEQLSHALRGSFHNQLALVLKQLGILEGRSDYLDRAIIEYTATIYHVGKAGNDRYRAVGENNLANLLCKMGRYRQAHERLDYAGAILWRLKDAGLLAQVDETRASIFIAEKKYTEAERVIARAVQTLEQGSAAALLADALTTQGIAWARLGKAEASINVLRRAIQIAEEVGALSNAGLATLALIEEHGARRTFSHADLYALYQRADRLLKDTQHPETIARRLACAQIVMRRLVGIKPDDKNFYIFQRGTGV